MPDRVEDFLNDPHQRASEVKIAHRLGHWWPPSDPTKTEDDITDEMIAEADAYLEAHIQWRIELATAVLPHTVTGFDGSVLSCTCERNADHDVRDEPIHFLLEGTVIEAAMRARAEWAVSHWREPKDETEARSMEATKQMIYDLSKADAQFYYNFYVKKETP